MARRQNRAAPNGPEDHPSFQRSFLWVPQTDDAACQERRAHAARQSYRQQRWQNSKSRPRLPVFFPWRRKLDLPNTDRKKESPSEIQTQLRGKLINRLEPLPSGRGCESALPVSNESNTIVAIASTSAARKAQLPGCCLYAVEEGSERCMQAEIPDSCAWWCSHSTPINILRSGNSDPFAAASIPVTSAVQELIQWSRAWYVHSLWPIEISESEDSSAIVSWQQDMRLAIQDKAYFHAVLAVASNYMATTQQGALKTSTLFQKGLRHKISSLAGLRQRLQINSTDSTTLSTIVVLGGAEFYAGDVETTVLHLEAANRIVSANGGLMKVPTSLRSLIGIADSVTSWRLSKRPIFPLKHWDPGSWSQQNLSQSYPLAAERLAQYATLNAIGFMNPQSSTPFLRSMLAELNELVSVQKLASSVKNRQHRNEIFMWLHVRRSAIKTHLLYRYLEVTQNIVSIKLEDRLEAAVCLAAWYCHGFIVYESLATHFPPQLVHHGLETLLRDAESLHSVTQLRLLLWLYFVGATVEELFENRLPDGGKQYFTTRFLATVKILKLVSWHNVREVLKSFLFDSVLENCLISMLASEVKLESLV